MAQIIDTSFKAPAETLALNVRQNDILGGNKVISGCIQTAQSPPSMSIDMVIGTGGSSLVPLSKLYINGIGVHETTNVVSAWTISPGTAGQTRKDLLCCRYLYGSEGEVATYPVITGDSSGSLPVVPDQSYIALGYVTLVGAPSSITQSMITNVGVVWKIGSGSGSGSGTTTVTGDADLGDVLLNKTFMSTKYPNGGTGTLVVPTGVATGTATSDKVLVGSSFMSAMYTTQTNGQMTNNGTVNATVPSNGGVYNLAGYYAPGSKVTSLPATGTASGTATAGNVLTGYSFTSTSCVTQTDGQMPNNGIVHATVASNGGVHSLSGYYAAGSDVTSLASTGTGVHGQQVFTYSASAQNFIPPDGVDQVLLIMASGGGGGGGALSSYAGGGGGSAGSIFATVNVTAGQSYSVVVGQGGSVNPNPANGLPGGNGTPTIFAGILGVNGGQGGKSGSTGISVGGDAPTIIGNIGLDMVINLTPMLCPGSGGCIYGGTPIAGSGGASLVRPGGVGGSTAVNNGVIGSGGNGNGNGGDGILSISW